MIIRVEELSAVLARMPISTSPLPTAPDRFEPLLTPVEAGAMLRIHEKTAIRLARERSLPGIRIGKHWRFRRSDLESWVSSRLGSNGQPVE
jgi:excisionase family DNA binding protein